MKTARRARRGFVLPVVLIMIGLLALTTAGFVFFVRSETAGATAQNDALQARLAAESGLEEVTALLRTDRDNSKAWFDAPARFRHVLVWGEGFDRSSDPVSETGSRARYLEDLAHPPAGWRYSLVAERWGDPFDTVRYGITPESAKLHLNTASDAQITQLLMPLLVGLQVQNPLDIINCILDWRSPAGDPRPGGAKDEYYNTLTPPYRCKNGPFDTLEELLLVKGVTAAILYGEDANRNGILDQNENDGDTTFPAYDNEDNILNRGIAPYLTVFSRDLDTATDNKPRINLNAGGPAIQSQIDTLFQQGELSDATINFITNLQGQGVTAAQLRSAADLFPGNEGEAASQPAASQPGGSGTSQPAGGGGGATSQPGALTNSPVTLEEMPYIMDRFSTRPVTQATAPLLGLVNINCAPVVVLMTVPGMTELAAASIRDTRKKLDAASLRTTAWPLVSGAVSSAVFKQIAPYITTKAYQFHVEAVGYADHVKTARRIEWVIEMIGPLAQVKYQRDLTSLGMAWPIDDDNQVTSTTQ